MLIKAENISVTRNKKEILKNINIVINQKDFITILGPNGAGKSMLLKCLLGFYKPDNGSIIKSPGLKISYTPQDFTIDKSIPITALDFITLMIYGLAANKVSIWLKGNPKLLNTISACVLIIIAIYVGVSQSY